MSTRRRLTLPRTLPMPLWLQAVLDLCFVALGTGVLAALVACVGWASLGFPGGAAQMLGAAGQLWLMGHGVGLHLSIPAEGAVPAASGLMTLTPLGLTLLWLFAARRSGARLARACYEGEFWKPVLAGSLAYGLIGVVVGILCSGTVVSSSPVASFGGPFLVAVVGLLWGGHRESGSWLRMIGVSPELLASTYSQYTRWAGAYFLSVLRAAWAGLLLLLAGGALLSAVALFWNWNDVIALFQSLHAGAAGDLCLTLLQLVLVPNFAVFGMAWCTGAGFSLGEGTHLSPALVEAGALPALPLLGAVPHGTGPFSYVVLLLPVLAGACAAWWFVRAGEDHLDDWLALKIRVRALSAALSALALALLLGLLVGLGAAVLALLARGSLGVGRFTAVGPHPSPVFLWTLVTVGLGALLGLLVAPWLERDPAAAALREEARERQARRRAAEKARAARTEDEAQGIDAAAQGSDADEAQGSPEDVETGSGQEAAGDAVPPAAEEGTRSTGGSTAASAWAGPSAPAAGQDAPGPDGAAAAADEDAAEGLAPSGVAPWQRADATAPAADEGEQEPSLTPLERLRRARDSEGPETAVREPSTPEADAPQTGTPGTETPVTETPTTEAPEAPTPEAEAHETEAHETATPETGSPESAAAEPTGSESRGSESTGAETTSAETGNGEVPRSAATSARPLAKPSGSSAAPSVGTEEEVESEEVGPEEAATEEVAPEAEAEAATEEGAETAAPEQARREPVVVRPPRRPRR